MNLTDYDLTSLRVIQAATESKIQEIAEQIRCVEKHINEPMRSDITVRDKHDMAILREHNVHLLNAIQVVKDRQDAEIADPERFNVKY